MKFRVGLDIGSTTIKAVVLNQDNEIVYKSYERHFSKVREKALEKIEELKDILCGHDIKIAITGSAGLGVAKESGVDFVQEVFATAGCVKKLLPETDVVIELGGEDAKIIFLKGALEERMNSTCAGGTGAFIDQMASLLNVDLKTLDEMSLKYNKIYPIASRCGVFAKSDIQPLINQGADKENIAASIFQAVVDQTISGLAQGRKIQGHVLFLGGPLSFLKGLQQRFVETLKLTPDTALFHPLAPYFVALGSAYYCDSLNKEYTYEEIHQALHKAAIAPQVVKGLKPLFATQQDYEQFVIRHSHSNVVYADMAIASGKAYLGIDAGSTTTKTVLVDDECRILYSKYVNNLGNPVDVVKEQLEEIYKIMPKDLVIAGAAATGYGEDLVKAAFHLDYGLVETVAHFTAAKYFVPNVDFIIDIGGQDMKCFRVRDGAIDDIVLNEACSSGCGSFIETFAKSLGYDIEKFSKLGLFAKNPVDLGSRCTVFMNSSVKQAQKNGATVEDISAGLAVSVVKNALYKVIRAKSADDIGRHVVVQGGTFLNDSVLRSFELELGRKVTRPTISGLMGAFGAALFAKNNATQKSSILTPEELKSFTHSSRAINCNGCTNHCNLTVNTFGDGKKLIAGNRCDRPVTGKISADDEWNLVAYKYKKLTSLISKPGPMGKIGIPVALNMYENLPFWHAFFTALGFEVVLSDTSSKQMYVLGQDTIASDTVCYPAKMVHGHIANLLEKGVDKIFYPCLSYNFDEGISDNCYNCPVVAYYPEVIAGNMDFDNTKLLYPYLTLNNEEHFVAGIYDCFAKVGITLNKGDILSAMRIGLDTYRTYKNDVFEQGEKIISNAYQNYKKIIVLAGRPYHIDPEINHGMDKLLTSLGFAVVTEDCVSGLMPYEGIDILNQWTYHARMFNAAKYVATQPGMEMVQLVSFGWGLDAITTDEVRSILRSNHKLYTQIKIDQIDNLGAAKIRLRSLLAAMEERERGNVQ